MVTVPLAFATMVLISRLAHGIAPPDVARIFARLHMPERLGIGAERLPAPTSGSYVLETYGSEALLREG